jgi:hypothetical protein
MGNESSTHSQDEKSPFHNVLDTASFMCGSVNDSNDGDFSQKKTSVASLLAQADALCISSPPKPPEEPLEIAKEKINPSSALFARALISEVTDNPNTMTPAVMAEREKKLLKAQSAARHNTDTSRKAVGAPGGVGQPSVLHSIAHVLGTEAPEAETERSAQGKSIPPNPLQENRAQVSSQFTKEPGKYRVTIGLSLSRRHSTVGHADTVTRQTAFDFNELQDREYKYVSSTDSSGWKAGGGERGGAPLAQPTASPIAFDQEGGGPSTPQTHKVAAPDVVHIPIIHIDAESPMAIDTIISALARGEVFIPHMGVLPEALSVNGISPPDLVVRFGCERNEDTPADEWPNWCLEFMHNQLYEYFAPLGAVWTKRPFQITLAKKVRWKTVKHMNRYFAHAERVLDAWREKGPQYLDPQLSYIEGGATPEEVARPHGIYLLRNGVPTNYFAPNFEPPYTTKMTRSLLLNVLDKSWDKKRREWTCEPVPRLVTPSTLMATMCGCTDPTQQGFMANQVTSSAAPQTTSVADVNYGTSNDGNGFDVPETMKGGLPEMGLTSVRSNGSKTSSYHLNPLDANPRQLQFHDSYDDQDDEDEEASIKFTSTASPGVFPTEKSSRYGRSPTPEGIGTSVRSKSPVSRRGLDTSTEIAPSELSAYNDSQTTVPHMNSSSVRLVERELERQKGKQGKKIMEGNEHIHVERRLLGAHLEGTLSEESETPSSFSFQNSTAVSKGAHSQYVSPRKATAKLDKALKDPRKAKLSRAVANYESCGKDKYAMHGDDLSTNSRGVPRSDSSVSLEYSMDSSLLGGDTSTWSGMQSGMDSSLNTNLSNASRRGEKKKKMRSKYSGDSQDDNLSLQTSQSSALECVPTDQELFVVGWAKALDPNSGSYYYFTLDRSKIVWDNPLAPVSVTSESLPTRTTAT